MQSQPLSIHRDAGLPQQAWLLRVSEAAELWCGAGVETRGDAFFEGAWSGAFGDFGFADCIEVFGSGAALTPNGWLLVPPSHTVEAVYALHLKSGEWLASNSIAFINQHTEIGFQGSDADFYKHFVTIVEGIDHSPSRISFASGEFYILHFRNALLSPDGLVLRPKPLPPDFVDFKGYRDYLSETVKAVARNAADPARRKTYTLLATVSSGYDSPACATIARAASCAEAVTIAKSREGNPDDGAEIGASLGLCTTVYDRPEFAGATREGAAEFYSTGMQAVDLIFEVLRGRLGGRIFVTGFHGDKIWDANVKPTSVIKRGDISGSGLSEFRLSEGFVHLPMPFIGVLRHDSLWRIAQSDEMKPFAIGGSYDRPIARRLVEEAGVRRTAFGQDKKAIMTLVHMRQALLDESIRAEIEAPLAGWPAGRRLKYRAGAAWFAVLYALIYGVSYKLPIGQGFYERTMSKILRPRHPMALQHSHPFNALALDWALRVVGRRYAGVSTTAKRQPFAKG
jgi:hypothetical protein